MNFAANYIVSYLIEIIKIILICRGIIGLELNLKFHAFLIAALFVIIIIIYNKEYQDYMPFIYGNMAAVTVALFCKGKNKWLYGILVYVFVSLSDMVIVSYIFYFGLSNAQELRRNYWMNIGVNSISIIFILAAITTKQILFRDFSKRFEYVKRKYIAMFITAGFIVALYFTPVINYNFSEETNSILSLFLCMGAILFIIIFLSFVNYNFKSELYRRKVNQQEKFIKAQRRYNDLSLKNQDKRRRFLHDIMFHMKSMYALFHNKKYEDLNEYFSGIIQRYDNTMLSHDAGNYIISAIIQDCVNRYPETEFTVSGLLPEKLNINDIDICTIFSNLLENAFYAADNSQKRKYVKIDLKVKNSFLYAVIENSYNPSLTDGSGLGSINVQECVLKNLGKIKYSRDNERFTVEVILPNAIK